MQMNRRNFLKAAIFGSVAAVATVKGVTVAGDEFERQRKLKKIVDDMNVSLGKLEECQCSPWSRRLETDGEHVKSVTTTAKGYL
jgi:hypothetical protein